ncbi:MAG: hypothetical protein HRT47_01680 [Candidatus Caenarcaniphilales bacterium]|nr:hypothetical protein [Candidatus Caenarcaniphilales bacterium]
MKTKFVLLVLLLSTFNLAKADLNTYDLYANDGTYLGNTSNNQYDPNSINNPYGKYGSSYSMNSIRNQYGQYGSRYSSTSPNNQFSTPGRAIPANGGFSQPWGGNSRF